MKLNGKGKYKFDAAYEAAQSNLVPCPGCGRTFAQDRIQVHQRICTRTGIVPGLSQAKPNIDPKSPFAVRMSYKPPPPNSDERVTNNFRKGRWVPKEESPRRRSPSKSPPRRRSLPTPRNKREASTPRPAATPSNSPRKNQKQSVSPAKKSPRGSAGQSLAKFCTNCGSSFKNEKSMKCAFCSSPRKTF